jgi:hypothetical protein
MSNNQRVSFSSILAKTLQNLCISSLKTFALTGMAQNTKTSGCPQLDASEKRWTPPQNGIEKKGGNDDEPLGFGVITLYM